jgi:multiple sugar transport system permease protein
MFPAPIAKSTPLRQRAYHAILALLLALWLLPLAGVALTSVRSIDDITRGNIWGWPTEFRLFENYAAVLTGSHMPQFILNSFLITLPVVVATVALSSMAGFALAKYRFRGNRLLLAIFIGGNLVPFQVLTIPVLDLMADGLGIYDTRWALVLFHTAFQSGFATLFMRNFIRELPDTVIDAARVEGIGELRIFLHIVLPLVRPAMAAVAVLIFTFVWNDYFWALILAHSNDARPVTSGVQALRGMWLASWHLVSAASLLAALPPAVVFFLMQRHFVAGLTLGVAND